MWPFCPMAQKCTWNICETSLIWDRQINRLDTRNRNIRLKFWLLQSNVHVFKQLFNKYFVQIKIKNYDLFPKTFGFNFIYVLKYQLLISLNMIPYTKTYLIKISCWFVDVMFYGCCSIYIYIYTKVNHKLFMNTLVNF